MRWHIEDSMDIIFFSERQGNAGFIQNPIKYGFIAEAMLFCIYANAPSQVTRNREQWTLTEAGFYPWIITILVFLGSQSVRSPISCWPSNKISDFK